MCPLLSLILIPFFLCLSRLPWRRPPCRCWGLLGSWAAPQAQWEAAATACLVATRLDRWVGARPDSWAEVRPVCLGSARPERWAAAPRPCYSLPMRSSTAHSTTWTPTDTAALVIPLQYTCELKKNNAGMTCFAASSTLYSIHIHSHFVMEQPQRNYWSFI